MLLFPRWAAACSAMLLRASCLERDYAVGEECQSVLRLQMCTRTLETVLAKCCCQAYKGTSILYQRLCWVFAVSRGVGPDFTHPEHTCEEGLLSSAGSVVVALCHSCRHACSKV